MMTSPEEDTPAGKSSTELVFKPNFPLSIVNSYFKF